MKYFTVMTSDLWPDSTDYWQQKLYEDSHIAIHGRGRVNSPYPGTCIGLAVMVNNVETLMYVLIEFIFCLGILKTPTWEAPEGIESCYFS